MSISKSKKEYMDSPKRNISTWAARKKNEQEELSSVKTYPKTLDAQMLATNLFPACIDDFGIKYVGQDHVEYLMAIFKENYAISHD